MTRKHNARTAFVWKACHEQSGGYQRPTGCSRHGCGEYNAGGGRFEIRTGHTTAGEPSDEMIDIHSADDGKRIDDEAMDCACSGAAGDGLSGAAE